MERSPLFLALDHHAMRREQGLPTVSVLAGPTDLATTQWRRWATDRSLHMMAHASLVPDRWVPQTIAELTKHVDLLDCSARWIARHLDQNANEFRRKLANQSPHDFEQFWAAFPPIDDRQGTASVARQLCRSSAAREALPTSEIAASLDAILSRHHQPWLRVLLALDGMISPSERPALLFSPPAEQNNSQWLEIAASRLAEFAQMLPSWALCLAVPEKELDDYLRTARESRAKALLVAGVQRVKAPELATLARQLNDPQSSATNQNPPALVEAYGVAARLAEQRNDAARSAAERFLFELLESLPRTTGRFTLNARLDFPFGSKPAEVDLCATDLRLAVEIDGYHHFTDAERYRRDRRKDWELQRRGYLVLRVLAEDVVREMEVIVQRIEEAMDCCAQRTPGEERVQ